MGQAILYCFRCSTQLRDVQFDQGKAFRIDSRVCCSECAPEVIRSLPPDLMQKLLSQISAKQPKTPAPSQSPRASNPRIAPVESARRAAPPGLPKSWIIGGSVSAAMVVIGAIVLFSGGSDPSTPPVRPGIPEKPTVKSPAKTPTTPEPAAETPGQIALKKARGYAKANPDDLYGQVREFEDLTLLEDKGEAGSEAKKAAATIKAKAKDLIERELTAMDREIADPVSRDQYGPVLEKLEAAKARMGWPEWKLGLDKRWRSLHDKVETQFGPLKAKAEEAKAKGDAAGLQAVVAQVQGWGIARYARELGEALDVVSAPPVKVVITDFEQPPNFLKFVGGEEFPGAKGSLVADETSSHAGRRSMKLSADFTGGGAYVGTWFDVQGQKDRDYKEIRIWLKTATVANVGVRLGDSSGQCHQKNGGFNLKRTTDWQELVIPIGAVVGGEHWGGANDAKWHGPATGFGLNVGKGSFMTPADKSGVLWIDDVEGVLIPTRDE